MSFESMYDETVTHQLVVQNCSTHLTVLSQTQHYKRNVNAGIRLKGYPSLRHYDSVEEIAAPLGKYFLSFKNCFSKMCQLSSAKTMQTKIARR